MEAELGQNAGHFYRLAVFKLNPNPFAYHFRKAQESRSLLLEQSQQAVRSQLPVNPTAIEIDRLPLVRNRLFGSVPEPCV